jgi:hypothetical protein
VSERWIVVLQPKEPFNERFPRLRMYLTEDGGWWADIEHATAYKSKEEAEQFAFSTVTAKPSLIGCVFVEKAS